MESTKSDILSKYKEDTSDDLLLHLKRHFLISEVKLDWMEKPLRFIQVDDKSRHFENNKKYLVNAIHNVVENDWIHLGEKKIRRTIKKYLDGIK